jgi:serine/threonine protein kinase
VEHERVATGERTLIDGRFEVLDTLGRGGMGVVYRALDRERGVEVALKTLRGITPESVLRFKTEFRALRDLRHPNLVELGELFESDGTWFFTMELVRGVSFTEWVRGTRDDATPADSNDDTDTALDECETVVDAPRALAARASGPIPRRSSRSIVPRIARPACDEARLRGALAGLARGLAALHGAGKVHCDVKPSNILIDDSGRAVLLDFGVVAELQQLHPSHERMLIGTVKYMAPEQARGEVVGPMADWYAVGVLIFQALTGRPPFAGVSQDELLVLKQHVRAPAPCDLVDEVPTDLDGLCRQMLDRDPDARPQQAEILEVLGVTPRADDSAAWGTPADDGQPFVGRHAELAALDAALADSRRGAVCVTIEGDSGVGKSALVDRFVELVRQIHPRLVVLRGRCHERERVPYNAIDGVVDDLARFLSSRRQSTVERLVPDGVGALLAVFPALRIVPVLADAARVESSTPTTASRGRAFVALRELFVRLAQRRPIVIAIDDLQWADGDSASALDELLREGDAPALCFIATKRPHDGEAVIKRLAAVADVRRIDLEGLAHRDAEELMRLVVADTPDPDHARHVIAESRGHPLFLRELMRQRSIGDEPIRLEQAIWARASRLDEPAQRLLAAVAIAGSPIPRHVAYAAANIAAADAQPYVAALTRDHLVRVHGARPQDMIEPFHDRVREAVYSHQPVERQRELHEALARALEAIGASPDALMFRFEAAGDRERAARYGLAAAQAALDAFAFGRAVELFRRALADSELAAPQRADLLVKLGEALANDGRTAEAAQAFLDAAALEAPDSDRQLDLLRKAAERFLMSGRLELGLATARTVLARANMTLPTTRLRAIAGILWDQVRMRGEHALTWPSREVADPKSLHADICWSISAGLSMVDSLLGAYFSGRAARLALRHGTPVQIARAMAAATIGAAFLGRRDRANRLLDAARRAAAEAGTPVSSWYVELARTGAEFMIDNDFPRCFASASALEGEWYAAGRGPGWETDIAMHFALGSQQMMGHYGDMARRVATLVHEAKRKGDLFQEVTLRVRFPVRHLLEDRPDVARDDVLDAVASWLPGADSFGNQRAWALWSRTRIALYAGALDTLEPELDDEWQRMHASLVGRVPLMRMEWYHAYGTYLLGRALVAKQRGQTSAAAVLHREAELVATRLSKIEFPAAATAALALHAAVAWVGGSDDVVDRLRRAIDEARTRETNVFTPMLERRLGEALGGSEGASRIARADAAARRAGFLDPERAAEIAVPTGRFS